MVNPSYTVLLKNCLNKKPSALLRLEGFLLPKKRGGIVI